MLLQRLYNILYRRIARLLPTGLQSPRMITSGPGFYKELRAQGYEFDIRANEWTQLLTPHFTTWSRSGMVHFGKICMSTQYHAPQRVLACAYTRHGCQASECAH